MGERETSKLPGGGGGGGGGVGGVVMKIFLKAIKYDQMCKYKSAKRDQVHILSNIAIECNA